MQKSFPQTFWGLVAIAIGLVIASFIAGGYALQVKRANDTITTTGSSRMSVQSDFAIWKGNLYASARSIQAASGNLFASRDRLARFFEEQNVPDSLVQFKGMNSWTVDEYDSQGRATGRVLSYNMNMDFELRSHDVDMIERIAREAEALLMEGIAIRPYGLEYYYTQLDEARVSLMAAATMDAKRRAEQIAGAAGNRVGSIRQARMGVIQVVQPNSTNVSDYGMYDTSTRDKDVVAVVNVTFAVK